MIEDINEIIRYSHRLINKSIYINSTCDCDALFAAFSKKCRQFGIDFVSIYSTTLFPYLYEINDKVCLVWDEHFWNIYDFFLHLLYKDVNDEEDKTLLSRKAFSLMQLVLSHTLEEYPSLARAMASNYHKSSCVFGLYNDGFQKPSLIKEAQDWSIYTRMFAFYHEIAHLEYNKFDPAAKEKARTKFLLFMKRLPDTSDPFAYVYPHKILELVEYMNQIIEDNYEIAIEEFFCDLQACSRMLALLNKENGQIRENIRMVLAIARNLNGFLASVNQCTAYWKMYYQNWHMASDIDQFIHNCNRQSPKKIVAEQYFRLILLEITFLWECKEKYDVSFVRIEGNTFMPKAERHIHSWNYVYETLFYEKKYYEENDLFENLAQKDALLQWK